MPPVLRKLLHFGQGIWVLQGSRWLRYAYISLPVPPEFLSVTRVLGRSGLWLKRRLGIVHSARGGGYSWGQGGQMLIFSSLRGKANSYGISTFFVKI